jgi:hypothetical protein
LGALAKAALVALLRLSGKRTLSRMNGFDPVVTVRRPAGPFTLMQSRRKTGAVTFP